MASPSTSKQSVHDKDDPEIHNSSTKFRSHFTKTVCLHDWWLTKADQGSHGKKLKLGVAGFTPREQRAVRVFSSAPILKRYDLLTLETDDGIFIVIEGCINKIRTKENGFPSEVVDHFVFGFPPYWEGLAQKYLTLGVCGEGPQQGYGKVINDEMLDEDVRVIEDVEDYVPKNFSLQNTAGGAVKTDVAALFEVFSHPVPRSGNRVEVHSDELKLEKGTKGNPERQEFESLSLWNENVKLDSASAESLRPETSISDITKSSIVNEDNFMKTTRYVKPSASLKRGGKDIEGTPKSRGAKSRPSKSNGKRNSSRLKAILQDKIIIGNANAECTKEDFEKTCGFSRRDQEQVSLKTSIDDSNQLGDNQVGPKDTPMKKPGISKEAQTSNKKRNRKLTCETPPTQKEEEKISVSSTGPLTAKRSRSGRLLLPTLEFWRNQMAIYDADRQITGIREDLHIVQPLSGCKSEPQRKRKQLT